jgi:hypothetical protein
MIPLRRGFPTIYKATHQSPGASSKQAALRGQPLPGDDYYQIQELMDQACARICGSVEARDVGSWLRSQTQALISLSNDDEQKKFLAGYDESLGRLLRSLPSGRLSAEHRAVLCQILTEVSYAALEISGYADERSDAILKSFERVVTSLLSRPTCRTKIAVPAAALGVGVLLLGIGWAVTRR